MNHRMAKKKVKEKWIQRTLQQNKTNTRKTENRTKKKKEKEKNIQREKN